MLLHPSHVVLFPQCLQLAVCRSRVPAQKDLPHVSILCLMFIRTQHIYQIGEIRPHFKPGVLLQAVGAIGLQHLLLLWYVHKSGACCVMFSLNLLLFPIRLLIGASSLAVHRFSFENPPEARRLWSNPWEMREFGCAWGQDFSFGVVLGCPALLSSAPWGCARLGLLSITNPGSMAGFRVMLSAPQGLAFCTYSLRRETAAKPSSEDTSSSISGSILAFYFVFTGCVLVWAVLVLVGWVLFVVFLFQKRKISKWYQKGKACEMSALLAGPSGSFKVKPLPSRARALNI